MVLKVHHAAVLITDVNLIGPTTGLELAHVARAIDPDLGIVVDLRRPCQSMLPLDVTFLSCLSGRFVKDGDKLGWRARYVPSKALVALRT